MTQPMDCPGTVRSHIWLYYCIVNDKLKHIKLEL